MLTTEHAGEAQTPLPGVFVQYLRYKFWHVYMYSGTGPDVI